jgi:[acyl-carrier-protein] S-malonyltransferase
MVIGGKNIAALFPGQGAQYVGMGKTLAEKYPAAQKIFSKSDDVLGFPISSLIFNGPEEELTLTKNSQPSIYIMSWAAFKVLQETLPNLSISFFAGLSLGEYTAYAAAGAFSFEDGLRLVRKRGELMQKSGETHPGTMASVMGLSLGKVESICSETNKKYPVNVANINSPGQIVISGSAQGVSEASKKCSEEGAKRVIPLKVSGAFHSSLMQEAADGLREYLAGIKMISPVIPVVGNVLARETETVENIKKTLAEQVTNSVRWEQSMEYLNKDKCINIFIECGCGNVLRGLLKRIAPEAVAFGIEDPDSLEKTVAALNGLI